MAKGPGLVPEEVEVTREDYRSGKLTVFTQTVYKRPDSTTQKIFAIVENHIAPNFQKVLKTLETKLDDKSIRPEEGAAMLSMFTGIRAGSEKVRGKAGVARTGVSNMRAKHVNVDGDTVAFNFIGKEGVPDTRTFNNPVLAKLINHFKADKEDDDYLFDSKAVNPDALTAWFNKTFDTSKYKQAGIHKFRHYLATTATKKSLKNAEKAGTIPTSFKSQREFIRWQNSIAENASKALNHIRVNKDGSTSPNTSTTINSYIDPRIWTPYMDLIEGGIDNLQKAFTPDWHAKGPDKERDIDKWAAARNTMAENRFWGLKRPNGRPPKNSVQPMQLSKTWMQSLQEQGIVAPLIKSVSSDGSRMWIENNGQQYVAFLGPYGSVRVETATFKPVQDPRPKSKPVQSTSPIRSIDIEDDF